MSKPDTQFEYYEKALRESRAANEPDHIKILYLYVDLGDAWFSIGSYEKAIEYYNRALQISKESYGPEHPDIAKYLSNLGNVWSALARLSLFSQAKFFLKIVIYNNINQLWNFGSFAEKHNSLIIQEIEFWVQM